MGVINLGSINIDHVYQVPYFVKPGETLSTTGYHRGLGGKGLNQSITLLRAGSKVCHIGSIAAEDLWLRQQIAATGLDTTYITDSMLPTGHAIVQVSSTGENAIFLYPGANHHLTIDPLEKALTEKKAYDWVLLQNETNLTGLAIKLALNRGKKVALSPAPYTPDLQQIPQLDDISLLVVNALEAQQLSGCLTTETAFNALCQRNPDRIVVMTLGALGLWAAQGQQVYKQSARPARVVDTTGAGDTVVGYLLAGLDEGLPLAQALSLANQAAAMTVGYSGAVESIPKRSSLPKLDH
jgi:ribokinase